MSSRTTIASIPLRHLCRALALLSLLSALGVGCAPANDDDDDDDAGAYDGAVFGRDVEDFARAYDAVVDVDGAPRRYVIAFSDRLSCAEAAGFVEERVGLEASIAADRGDDGANNDDARCTGEHSELGPCASADDDDGLFAALLRAELNERHGLSADGARLELSVPASEAGLSVLDVAANGVSLALVVRDEHHESTLLAHGGALSMDSDVDGAPGTHILGRSLEFINVADALQGSVGNLELTTEACPELALVLSVFARDGLLADEEPLIVDDEVSEEDVVTDDGDDILDDGDDGDDGDDDDILDDGDDDIVDDGDDDIVDDGDDDIVDDGDDDIVDDGDDEHRR